MCKSVRDSRCSWLSITNSPALCGIFHPLPDYRVNTFLLLYSASCSYTGFGILRRLSALSHIPQHTHSTAHTNTHKQSKTLHTATHSTEQCTHTPQYLPAICQSLKQLFCVACAGVSYFLISDSKFWSYIAYYLAIKQSEFVPE